MFFKSKVFKKLRFFISFNVFVSGLQNGIKKCRSNAYSVNLVEKLIYLL